MVFKFFILAALVVVSQAGYLEPYAYTHQAPIVRSYVEPTPVITRVSEVPIIAPVTKTHVQPAPAHYDFGYTVDNPYDAHHQTRTESRRGDVVTGSYSVLDADGTKRIVDYTATPLGGFRAVVRKVEGVVAPPSLLPAYV